MDELTKPIIDIHPTTKNKLNDSIGFHNQETRLTTQSNQRTNNKVSFKSAATTEDEPVPHSFFYFVTEKFYDEYFY